MLSFLDEMDPFERDIFIIEKTCSLKLSQIFQNHNATLYIEASSNKKEDTKESNGLVEMIQSAAKSIVKMIEELIDKIKVLFTGEKVDDDKEVRFSKNPVDRMRALDISIREDVDMIYKLKNGEAGMDDAKQLLNKHSSILDEITPYVGPIKDIAKEELMSFSILGKWKTQINRVCHIKGKELSAASRELARSKGAGSQNEVIDQAVQMVLNEIQKNSTEGSNILLDFGKKFYVKKEVTERLRREANDMNSLSGGMSYRAKLRAERRQLRKETRQARRESRNIDANENRNARARLKNARAEEQRSAALAGRWNDVSAKKFTASGEKKRQEDEKKKHRLRNNVRDLNSRAASIDRDEVVRKAKESKKQKETESGKPIGSKIQRMKNSGTIG